MTIGLDPKTVRKKMNNKVEMSIESILELIRHGIVAGTNPVPLIDDLLAAIRTDSRFEMLRTKKDKGN